MNGISRLWARRSAPGVILLLVLTAFMLRSAIFLGRAMVHGDSIEFGLPLVILRARFIQGHAAATWVESLFGGHPMFAEGQAAFASPLPMLLSALVAPIAGPLYAENLFPFFYVVLTGIGVLGLALSLGLSRWAAVFSMLAVAYSLQWLDLQSNVGVSGTFLWVPWCLWAMEVWLERPGFRSAAIWALALANMITAGYAQTFHGTVLYMAISLIAIPFSLAARRDWLATWRMRVGTGAVAALLCAGLAAIQLLPLFELVGLSHRSGGTALQLQFPARYFIRGMFYTLPTDPERLLSFPNIGSLLVCAAASTVILLRPSTRIVGHLVASLVLFQLGLGQGSPFFRFVYDHNIVPGLHYLRGVSLYTEFSTLGIGIMAGRSIDGIAGWLATDRRPALRRPVLWGLIALAALWVPLVLWVRTPAAPTIQYAVVGVAIVGAVALARLGRATSFPVLMTALLAIECLALRVPPFQLYDPSYVAEPGSAKAIEAVPDWQDYKVFDASLAAVYSFHSSRSPEMLPGLSRMLSAITGSTPILWKMNGMDGSLALPLARRTMLTPRLTDEIDGKVDTPPGARLIDLLGVRFVAAENPISTPAFRPFWHEGGGVWMAENMAAKPRFQAYSGHVTVASPDQALDLMEHWSTPTLVIENPPGAEHQPEMQDAPADGADAEPPALTFRVERAKSTSYRLSVSAERPGWLFLADANYPGWTAKIDGRPVPLFSAQVLGKAVAVPAGDHAVAIEFRSQSVRWGAAISAASLVLFAALFFGAKWAET